MHGMNFIEIENLSYRYSDGTLGVKDINLTIREGEFVVLAGPNGSGKTTLLRHFNGLHLPHTGSIKVYGIPVSQDILRARQIIGMVFQDADSQIVGETVYDDVAFGPENLKLTHSEVRRRVSSALEAVSLSESSEKRPHTLSGGEKRRLAIAGILAMKPKAIVFDETFSELDYDGVKQVLTQMLSLHHQGHTIVVTTHDLEKVIAHANRLIIMNNGKVVRDGLPAELLGETEAFGVREPCASRMGMEIEPWLI